MDTLLSDLDAFFSEHRGCATDLAGGMLDDQPRAARDQADDSGCVVWLALRCVRCDDRQGGVVARGLAQTSSIPALLVGSSGTLHVTRGERGLDGTLNDGELTEQVCQRGQRANGFNLPDRC